MIGRSSGLSLKTHIYHFTHKQNSEIKNLHWHIKISRSFIPNAVRPISKCFKTNKHFNLIFFIKFFCLLFIIKLWKDDDVWWRVRWGCHQHRPKTHYKLNLISLKLKQIKFGKMIWCERILLVRPFHFLIPFLSPPFLICLATDIIYSCIQIGMVCYDIIKTSIHLINMTMSAVRAAERLVQINEGWFFLKGEK